MAELDKTAKRRSEIVMAAAAHLIENGLRTSSLRAIAKSAGLSDRMIMYYFKTKEDLVADALLLIGDQLLAGIEAALPGRSLSVSEILDALSNSMSAAETRAVMRLWFEIVGQAMRGEEPYRSTAATLLERSEERIRDKLRSNQKHRARELLGTLEGRLMVDLIVD